MNEAVTGCPTYDLSTLNGSSGGIIPGTVIEGDPGLVGDCKVADRNCQKSSAVIGIWAKKVGEEGGYFKFWGRAILGQRREFGQSGGGARVIGG